MENNQKLIATGSERNPLWEDILKFSRSKYILAVILVLFGLLGLIIPVIPGLLLLLMAVALFRPGLMAKIRRKINQIFKKS